MNLGVPFSAPMLRAMRRDLDPKTQTRRLITPQPEISERGHLMGPWLSMPLGGLLLPRLDDIAIDCPNGQVGDVRYVKEGLRRDGDRIAYAVDDVVIPGERWKWKVDYLPSIFMPTRYARDSIRWTGIRVERLHEISEADAKAEGVDPVIEYSHESYDRGDQFYYIAAYRTLWDSLSGKRAPWSSNPYVWVLSFERVR